MTSWRQRLQIGCAAVAMLAFAGAPTADANSSGPFGLGNIFGGATDAPSEPDDAAAQKAAQAKADSALLDQLTPTDLFISPEAAQRLEAAIVEYQRIVDAGGWPLIPKGTTLHLGDQDEVVQTLRKRLFVTGDLAKAKGDWTFDELARAGLIRFQRRHGLLPNGVLDVRTVYALNVTAEDRLTQLRVSLRRMQEFVGRGLPDRYVMVNIPAMELQAIDDGRIVVRSRTVVGRSERQTPGVAAKIQGLNFFPYWKVPESVANKDLIPKMGKDPEYLTSEHIRVLSEPDGQEIDPHAIDWKQRPLLQSVRFRQDPGDFNALGLVRVDMPNADDVYMHDTPLKELFRRATRNFSSGCVRVQKILDLVTWLAGTNGDWDRARVDSVLQAGVATDVKLKKPVNVYFIYQTAWVDTEMGIAFRSDIYGRDGNEALAAANRDREAGGEALPPVGLSP